MKYKYVVLFLFLVSGISGLMYEVVWLRMLTRITGVTVYATATVVAAYMAGLALGSFLFGRFIDKREDSLRIYAILEFLVACAALLVPVMLAASTPLSQLVFRSSGESIFVSTTVGGATSFISMLIATTMMGGTLPVLTSFLVKRDNLFGGNLGKLYGLNTLGAVFGVLLSGFVTIGAFGESATIYIAAAINLLVALSAYCLFISDRRVTYVLSPDQRNQDTTVKSISRYPETVKKIVVFTFAISGFTALAYEVIWTRQLILFLKTSIYAFSGMLALFLTGIALGSFFMSRIVDRFKSPLTSFGFLEVVIGFLSLLNLHLFYPLCLPLTRDISYWIWSVFASFIIVFPTTFVFGMIFPVAASCYTREIRETGSSIGRLYASNTVGGILGSLVAGLMLIPFVGSTKTVIILAFVNIVLGLILFAMERGKSVAKKLALVPVIIAIALLALAPMQADPILTTVEKRIFGSSRSELAKNISQAHGSDIFLNKEGLEGTITILVDENTKGLWINGIGMTMLCTETKLMGLLPLMFAENPSELLVICFGMGTTVKSVLTCSLNSINVTAVDLVPETFENFKYFHPNDQEVLKKTNVTLVTNDGRNHLLLSSKKYDVITVDPAPPIWSAGTVNLYSKEFLQLCKDRLTPSGSMCLWFPGGKTEDNLAILRTFSEVFPHSSVWKGPHGWGYYFIGTIREVPWALFEQNVNCAFQNPCILKDMSEYDNSVTSAKQLYSLLLEDNDELKKLRSQGVIITDNHPFTEFFLWRRLLGNDQRLFSQNLSNWN